MWKKEWKKNEAAATIKWLATELKQSFDFVQNPLEMEDRQAILLYLKTVVDGIQLQEVVIKPFFEFPTAKHVEAYLMSLPQQQEIQSKEQILLELTKGSVVITLNGQLLLFDFKKINTDTVMNAAMEPTIQGPELGLSEDIATNLNLISQRYHQPSLSIEMFEVGGRSNQSLAIIYDRELVNKIALEKVKTKIQSLNIALVQSSAELLLLMNTKKRSLLPILMITERTDRMVNNLASGKVIIMLDGNPSAIIAPAVFFDFMASMEDNYHSYWVSMFIKTLRYFGLLICLTLPGLYVAFTSYNPEILRAELALSLAGSRIGVPYPSFIEVAFMLVFMELLTEASIRLPKAVSATATTVGGLILGTAATEAALTSNIMVIIVSAVAISTFVVPINEMSFAIRVVRFGILLFSTFAGLIGLTLGLLGFAMYLTSLNSFGEPYFKLFIQKKKDETKGVQS